MLFSIGHPHGDSNTPGRRVGLSHCANAKLISLRSSIPEGLASSAVGKGPAARGAPQPWGSLGVSPQAIGYCVAKIIVTGNQKPRCSLFPF